MTTTQFIMADSLRLNDELTIAGQRHTVVSVIIDEYENTVALLQRLDGDPVFVTKLIMASTEPLTVYRK